MEIIQGVMRKQRSLSFELRTHLDVVYGLLNQAPQARFDCGPLFPCSSQAPRPYGGSSTQLVD
jgi:hypothetical protein